MKTRHFIFTLLAITMFSLNSYSKGGITAEKIGNRIDVTVNNRFFTSYLFHENEKYPFLFPDYYYDLDQCTCQPYFVDYPKSRRNSLIFSDNCHSDDRRNLFFSNRENAPCGETCPSIDGNRMARK